ncbi:MAG: glycosyl hydrolase [Candidatus Sumerlaeia bacterium]
MGKTLQSVFFFGAILYLVVCPRLSSAIEPVNPDLSQSGRDILNYFESIYTSHTLYGYNVYVHTPDVYEQTGMNGAIFGRDIRWLGNVDDVVADVKEKGYILTLHWHWFYDGESAWTRDRTTPVNFDNLITTGTAEYNQMMTELAAKADVLQVFEDNDIPILWRPLHEIDGGWFWWTDKTNPANTAELWRIMYRYFTHDRGLDNLIWVYSAGTGNKTFDYRQGFYPGADFVDISGIDIYGVDPQNDVQKYWDYFDMMSQVSPGKMLAMGEGDAMPDPDKMSSGALPRWLYALPWWGTPTGQHPYDWALFTMRHDWVITLDELPYLGSHDYYPAVGLLDPMDDGSAWLTSSSVTLETYAVDRGGSITQVDFYADGNLIGSLNEAPWTLHWEDAPAGYYNITAVATDNSGQQSTTNNVRMAVLMKDLARGASVTASSGSNTDNAVDGDYYTNWQADKSDDEWLYVDLGRAWSIDQVNLHWGWKIHPTDFTVDVCTGDPSVETNWTTVYSETGRAYESWKASDYCEFDSAEARYVRVHATKRAGNQTWGGYKLMAIEVPIPWYPSQAEPIWEMYR